MTDANIWIAVAAVITILFQLLTAAYFFGNLAQRVRLMAESSAEERKQLRKHIDDMISEVKVELRDLRNRLWRHGNID